MRQVNRANFTIPQSLSSLKDDDQKREKLYEYIRNGNDPQNRIYASEESKDKLKQMYKNKCYLCEKKIDNIGVVEHFLPHSVFSPERAYDWNNLHWCCETCNQAKKSNEFNSFENRSYTARDGTQTMKKHVSYVKLIDPSNPPFNRRVDELIGFKNGEAYSKKEENEGDIICMTIVFLNSLERSHARLKHYSSLMKVILVHGQLEIWRDYLAESAGGQHIEPHLLQTKYEYALEKADDVYLSYLMEDSPYFVCISYRIIEDIRLSVKDFKTMSEEYRKLKELPLL